MKKFNQKEYIQNYQKEHYSAFKVDLKKEEKEELDVLLKKGNLTKAQFLRNAIVDLKENLNKGENRMKELLEKYDIERIEDFVPEFYYQNLVNGYNINKKAVKILLDRYSKEELIKVTNYDEIGIVEYVANDDFYIKDNKIIAGFEE